MTFFAAHSPTFLLHTLQLFVNISPKSNCDAENPSIFVLCFLRLLIVFSIAVLSVFTDTSNAIIKFNSGSFPVMPHGRRPRPPYANRLQRNLRRGVACTHSARLSRAEIPTGVAWMGADGDLPPGGEYPLLYRQFIY